MKTIFYVVMLFGCLTITMGLSNAQSTDTISYVERGLGNRYYCEGKEILYPNFEKDLRLDLSSDSSALHVYNEGHKYLVMEDILAGTGGAILGLGVLGSIILWKVQWRWIGTGLVTGFILPIPFAAFWDDKALSAVLIFNRDKKSPNTSSSDPVLGAVISKSF